MAQFNFNPLICSIFIVQLFIYVCSFANGPYVVQFHYPVNDSTCSGNHWVQGIIYSNNLCNGVIGNYKWKYIIINNTYVNQTGYGSNYCTGTNSWRILYETNKCIFTYDTILIQPVYQKLIIAENLSVVYEIMREHGMNGTVFGYHYYNGMLCSFTPRYSVFFKGGGCSWSQFDPTFHCTELGNYFIPTTEDNINIKLNIFNNTNCSNKVGECLRNYTNCIDTYNGFIKWWYINMTDTIQTTTLISSTSTASVGTTSTSSTSTINTGSTSTTSTVSVGTTSTSSTSTINTGLTSTINTGLISTSNTDSTSTINTGSISTSSACTSSTSTINTGLISTSNTGSISTSSAGTSSTSTINTGLISTSNTGSTSTINTGSTSTINTGSTSTINTGSTSTINTLSTSILSESTNILSESTNILSESTGGINTASETTITNAPRPPTTNIATTSESIPVVSDDVMILCCSLGIVCTLIILAFWITMLSFRKCKEHTKY